MDIQKMVSLWDVAIDDPETLCLYLGSDYLGCFLQGVVLYTEEEGLVHRRPQQVDPFALFFQSPTLVLADCARPLDDVGSFLVGFALDVQEQSRLAIGDLIV